MLTETFDRDGTCSVEGLLNDWDLCRFRNDIDLEATQIDRTVCTHFMLLHS